MSLSSRTSSDPRRFSASCSGQEPRSAADHGHVAQGDGIRRRNRPPDGFPILFIPGAPRGRAAAVRCPIGHCVAMSRKGTAIFRSSPRARGPWPGPASGHLSWRHRPEPDGRRAASSANDALPRGLDRWRQRVRSFRSMVAGFRPRSRPLSCSEAAWGSKRAVPLARPRLPVGQPPGMRRTCIAAVLPDTVSLRRCAAAAVRMTSSRFARRVGLPPGAEGADRKGRVLREGADGGGGLPVGAWNLRGLPVRVPA